ncbi:hypothetical protein OQA88_11040 [Cercophora sp. LCS_1]
MPKTFFLSQGWSLPSTAPVLGSIITNPSQPEILFEPSTIPPTTTTSTPHSFSSSGASSSVSPQTKPGLFSIFLSLYGLGDEPSFTFDRKNILSYTYTNQRAVHLTPTAELLSAAVSDTRVAQLFAAGLGVYMITGIKTITGASVKVASSKGGKWTADLGVASGKDDEGTIFALEVKQLVKQGDDYTSVVLTDLETDKDGLQGRLLREFGADAFKVGEGVDEVDGETCLVVQSNPIFVDVLTAGTVKVGGEHGIWY